MNKLYDYDIEVKVGNKEFQNTSIWKHLRYGEMIPEDRIIELDTFKKAYDWIADRNVRNAQVGTTFFLGLPMIRISVNNGGLGTTCYELTQKNFKPITIKYSDKEVTTSYTIKELSSELPADDFIQYIKDRGIAIPTNLIK